MREIDGAQGEGGGQILRSALALSLVTDRPCRLVPQTILPPLLTASGSSEILLEGGTHNPAAPPCDFRAEAFLPLLRRMGPEVTP